MYICLYVCVHVYVYTHTLLFSFSHDFVMPLLADYELLLSMTTEFSFNSF